MEYVLLGLILFLVIFLFLGILTGNSFVLRLFMRMGIHLLCGNPEKDFRALRKFNPDCIGWLSIPETCYAPIMRDKDGFYRKKDALGRESTYGELILADDSRARALRGIGKVSLNEIGDLAMIIGSSESRLTTKRGVQFTWLRKYVNSDLKQVEPNIILIDNGRKRIFRVAFSVELGIEQNKRGISYMDRDTFLQGMLKFSGVNKHFTFDSNVLILNALSPLDSMLVFLVEQKNME